MQTVNCIWVRCQFTNTNGGPNYLALERHLAQIAHSRRSTVLVAFWIKRPPESMQHEFRKWLKPKLQSKLGQMHFQLNASSGGVGWGYRRDGCPVVCHSICCFFNWINFGRHPAAPESPRPKKKPASQKLFPSSKSRKCFIATAFPRLFFSPGALNALSLGRRLAFNPLLAAVVERANWKPWPLTT